MRLDEPMSHLIEAGGDFFLMPSLFEPVLESDVFPGLWHHSLTSRVGGLVDTVTDADEDPEGGTGLTFRPMRQHARDARLDAMRCSPTSHVSPPCAQRGMQRISRGARREAYEQLYNDSL